MSKYSKPVRIPNLFAAIVCGIAAAMAYSHNRMGWVVVESALSAVNLWCGLCL